MHTANSYYCKMVAKFAFAHAVRQSAHLSRVFWRPYVLAALECPADVTTCDTLVQATRLTDEELQTDEMSHFPVTLCTDVTVAAYAALLRVMWYLAILR